MNSIEFLGIFVVSLGWMEAWMFSIVTIKVLPYVLSGFYQPYKVMRHGKFLSGTAFLQASLWEKGSGKH